MTNRIVDLVIVGAGPNGLAIGYDATKRGLDTVILERGHLAESITHFPKEMVFYGKAGDQEIAGLPCDCARAHPTREEFLSYLGRVVRLTGLDLWEQTTFRSLEGSDGDFVVHAIRRGEPVTLRCRKLAIATGVFGRPRKLDVPGAELAKVTYAYHDPYMYRRQRVAVVGAGSGAAEAALRLYREADAEVTVLKRSGPDVALKWRWRFPDIAELLEHDEIRMVHGATLEQIEESHIVFSSPAGREQIPNDHVIAQIGYLPDTAMFDALGISYDHSGTPTIDPRTMQTNVKGVYLAGHVATGTNSLILIRSTRNHGKVIVADILGEAPKIDDLGVENAAHWLQFEALDEPLERTLALELVPVVTGHFSHQLIDVYQDVVGRHFEKLRAQGVPLDALGDHPITTGAIINELSEEHFQVHDDGSIFFKGQEFPGDALTILRLADGTRRIRDIVAEIEAIYANSSRRLPADTVIEFLLDLLRIGKLTWWVKPLPPTSRATQTIVAPV